MSKQPSDADVGDIFDYQIKTQDVGIVKVSDGHVLMLTDVALESLLEKARANSERKVVIFIKHGEVA